jgi:LuxR family transcriptional regulator, maltose regulon positive regulatory protein
MSTPILATKLHIPAPPPKIVNRTQLVERLNTGLHRKLTLISAPAGFGKSALVSEWVAGCERPVAWLSLDEGDNDLNRFLVGLVAALQTIVASMGAGVLGVLQSPRPPPTESVLTVLLNEISAVPDPFILVLDDYHALDSRPVDQALTFLIEHLPPAMHLVITTREDPHLPLARLRVRSQLTELRVTDLRFTRSEATEFLNQVMGLDISEADIAALETRTEGWIAGLQLAALALQGTTSMQTTATQMTAMQGYKDPHSFIQSFTGSHHFVMDYLVEEVLQQQPASVQTFLLRTSILDRLCGSLCDAVLLDASASGQKTLEYLEHANLFMVPLDNERRWYRYHHLFAELLRQRLRQSSASPIENKATSVAELHNRASQWHEHHDSLADAICHALAAENFERAANLVEREWPAMHRSYFRSATTLGWMKALPDALVRARPVLSVGYAWELLNAGQLEAAETRLRDAERWLGTTAPTPERVVVDEAEFQMLPASIATARAYHALALGNVPDTVTYARRALDLFPMEDYVGRGPAAALLSLAYWASGDLEAAHRTLADSMAGFQKAGNILFAINGVYGLADIRIAQGRLHEAISTYEQALQLATAQGEPVLQGTADFYLGLSELYREQGDLESARTHLLKSQALGEPAALPDWPYRLCLAQARMKQAQGDLDDTLDLLDKAVRLYSRGPVPNVRPIAAMKAWVWLAQGRLPKALGWVHERGLSVEDDLSYLREFEHITLARVLIAQHKQDRVEGSIRDALKLLARLLQPAEAGGRMGSVIEILVLQALAYAALADIRSALVPLQQALMLAEPEGYVRIFVDEGLPMAALLQAAAKQGIAPNYVSQLRAAFGEAEGKRPVTQPLAAQPILASEPLSERELDVLRLLRTELGGPEIARELRVSLNTLRTHTQNIYNKLGVNNRRLAVHRAEELGLY